MKLSQPQQFVLSRQKAINLFMAGMGSGKTFLGGTISAYFVSMHPQVKGFIGANTYGQLNLSTMYRIRYEWENDFGMYENIHYVVGTKPPSYFNTEHHHFDRYNDIVSFINGAVIFIGSLENAKAHEGKEFAWAILDETKDSKEEDVKTVIIMRLREKGLFAMDGTEWNPLYILTSPAKVRWLNEWFGLEKRESEIKKHIYSETDYYKAQYENKAIVISSTYHNAKNLPSNYIDNKRYDLTIDQFNRIIYADPFLKTGGEFYSAFNRRVHVGKVPFQPGLTIHMTVDQNVVPYYTGLLIQVVRLPNDAYQVRVFKEYCMPNPNNKTEKVCQKIKADWRQELSDGFRYYGDATGRNRDTRGETDYEILRRSMAEYIDNSSDRVLHRNPSVSRRREFINRIMEGGKLPIELIIDESCVETIADLEYVKETPDGGKHKEKVKENSVSFEKYGHTSDALDYFFVSCFKDYFKE